MWFLYSEYAILIAHITSIFSLYVRCVSLFMRIMKEPKMNHILGQKSKKQICLSKDTLL